MILQTWLCRLWVQIKAALRTWRLPLVISVAPMLLLGIWARWGWSNTSLSSLQWTLSAVIQSMAILLGLVLGLYIFILDRSDRSVDHLQGRWLEMAQDVAQVLPSVVRSFNELRSSDPYWLATQRKLAILGLSLTHLLPDGAGALREECHAVVRHDLADFCDKDVHQKATRLAASPDEFITFVHSLSNLAPLEPDFPHRSVLSNLRQEYIANLARHVRAVERSHWVSGGQGKALPLMLALTFFVSALLLSISSTTLPKNLVVGGMGVVLGFCAIILMLLAWMTNKVLLPTPVITSNYTLHKLQIRRGKKRLSA